MGASFSSIGGVKIDGKDVAGVRLADLKVTGYENDESQGYSCYGAVDIAVIENDGSNVYYTDGELAGVEVKYLWMDDTAMGVESMYPAGWYDPMGLALDGEQSPYGDANVIQFVAGEGIFFEVMPGFEQCKLVSNGEVIQAPVSIIFGKELYNYIANPLPVTIMLSKISVTGYEEDESQGYSCYGAVDIAVIENDGSNVYYTEGELEGVEVKYLWMDDTAMGVESMYPAGWYDPMGMALDGEQSPYGDATKIPLNAGESFVFEVGPGFEQCAVVFPSLAEATAK